MKQLIFLVILGCITTMALTSEKRYPKSCQTICTMVFDPVCAGGPGETPKSFGNECVMKNYNCENNKNVAIISDGECPGGGGIRLQ